MIGRLSGTLVLKQPPQIVLDVNGVGYEIELSLQSFAQLPSLNAPATLLMHTVIREDAYLLYGFLTEAERRTFRQLLKVNGIGAKIALTILSVFSADELALVLESEDITRLCKVPGIGKKTAERMLLELRGKLSAAAAPGPLFQGASTMVRQDIIDTLLALGFAEREVTAAVKTLPEDIEVSAGVTLALKHWGKH